MASAPPGVVRRRRAPRLLLLATAVAGAAVLYPSSSERSSGGLEQRLPALIAFVEAERGLEMRRDVEVRVLDDEAFLEAFYDDVPADPPAQEPAVEGQAATYGALGLVAAEDFDQELRERSDESLVGFYDGVTEELVVRDEDGPYLDLVVVHELTHALQDQWFGVDRPSLGYGTEPQLAFDSLVEGDARRVERAWFDRLDAADRRAVEAVDPGVGDPVHDDGRLLDPVESTVAFPYAAGPRLVAHLLEHGGQAALDAAFRDPPVTTEQVLHPEDIASQGTPLVPPAPAHPGTVVDEGVLGERGLALLVGAEPLAPDGPQVGWEGDSYRTHRVEHGRLCTVATVHMDDAAARERLTAALEDVGVHVEVVADTGLTLRACNAGD